MRSELLSRPSEIPVDNRRSSSLDSCQSGSHGNEMEEPFHLQIGPLLRGQLLQLGPEDYRFVICLHHLVCDGWSLGIFCRDLSALYNAVLSGRTSSLQPLHLQYSDYVHWQKEIYLKSDRLSVGLQWWRETLHGIPARHGLVTNRIQQSSSGAAAQGGRVFFTLQPDLVSALKIAAGESKATLFSMLYAAYCATISHFSCNTEDIVVGSGSSGRGQQGLDDVIGFFVSTIVLRLRV